MSKAKPKIEPKKPPSIRRMASYRSDNMVAGRWVGFLVERDVNTGELSLEIRDQYTTALCLTGDDIEMLLRTINMAKAEGGR